MKNFLVSLILSVLAFFVITLESVAATPQWHTAQDGRIYLIETNSKHNWFQAWNECARKRMQLIAIDGPEKNKVVVDLLKLVFGYSPNLWIGATDEYQNGKDRPFYWSATGQKMDFTHWKSGEPNNLAGSEHCVYIWAGTEYRWNDAPCETILGYICEMKM